MIGELLVLFVWKLSFLIYLFRIIVYAISYFLATHFWIVTERVLDYKNLAYNQCVVETMWSRMMTRGLLHSTVIIGVAFWPLEEIA